MATNEPKPKTETPTMKPETPFDQFHATMTAYWNELSAFEHTAYERAKAMSADLAKLATESFTYANQLAAEWRKLGLEATRKLTEQFARA